MSITPQQKLVRKTTDTQYIRTKDGVKIIFPSKSRFDQIRNYLTTKYKLDNLITGQSSSSSYSYSSYSSSTGTKPITQKNSSNKQEYYILIPNKELRKI
jgi:hypothetical protein